MHNLRPRLKAVAGDVAGRGFHDAIYDIGADHAWLPISLVKSGACGYAVATDISRKSADRARRAALAEGVSDRLRVFVGDGFDAIPEILPGMPVIVMGIGGKNLIEIIKKGLDRARAAKPLILQPMNNHEHLRAWLMDNSFSIAYERLAAEDNRIYSILFCEYAGAPQEYSAEEPYIGKRVVYEGAGDYIKFLRFVRLKLNNRYGGLKAARGAESYAPCGEAERLAYLLLAIDHKIRDASVQNE